MLTNEERQIVAYSLRNLASYREVDKELVEDVLGLYMGECVNGYDPVSVVYVADLIVPEPERTCKFVHQECRHPGEKDPCGKYQDCEWSCAKDSLYCSSCDKCVAVSFGRQLKVKKYSFCPYCGAKVVNNDNQ